MRGRHVTPPLGGSQFKAGRRARADDGYDDDEQAATIAGCMEAAAAGRPPYGYSKLSLAKGRDAVVEAAYASDKFDGGESAADVAAAAGRTSLSSHAGLVRLDGRLLCVSIPDGTAMVALTSGDGSGNSVLQVTADGLMARTDDDDVHSATGGSLFTIPDGAVVSHHVISHSSAASDMSVDGAELSTLLSSAQSPPSGSAADQAACGNGLTEPDAAEAAKQKRKGGWPKGKRRKPLPLDGMMLKGPASGYVLFAKERRKCLRQTHPHLTFSQATRVLGKEWSDMDSDLKQKYLNQADSDRERYKEELRAYQESELYQNFAKRRNFKRVAGAGSSSVDYPVDELISLDDSSIYGMDDEDPNELHCRVCNKYFSNLHNKKEHMVGKAHLQNLSTELEKEVKLLAAVPATAAVAAELPSTGGDQCGSLVATAAIAASCPSAANPASCGGGRPHDGCVGGIEAMDDASAHGCSAGADSDDSSAGSCCGGTSSGDLCSAVATEEGTVPGIASVPTTAPSAPVDVEAFVNGFWRQNYERELEIAELHANAARLQVRYQELQSERARLELQHCKLQEEAERQKAHGAQIEACINSLRILPTLFDTIDF